MLLERLCNANSPSGYEGEVREIIKDEIKNYVDEIKIDRMGNVIAHKKGTGKTVLVDVHIDEPGFVITGYNDDGTLKFATLGVVDYKIVPCKGVNIGKNKIQGVIGIKPIHLQNSEEREKSYDLGSLCIDIGAKSKEEAKKIISLGDFAVFTTKFEAFGHGFVKGKAISSRVGCNILIELLKEEYQCDFYGVFSVQGELKGRGSYISAYNLRPEIAIMIKGSLSSDLYGEEKIEASDLGKGPVIPIMDEDNIFNSNIIENMKSIALQHKIPFQFKKSMGGSNSGEGYFMSGASSKIGCIGVPCRYANTAISLCSLEDYNNSLKLAKEYLKSL